MRWFKHLTIANRDENLSRIRDEFGLEGYGLYWLLLESIAEQMDDSGRTDLELSPKNWRRITGIAPQKFQKFLSFAETLEIFSVEISENLIKIDCPKLLKYRDEYTKKRKKTPDKLRTNSGECQEQDTDTDTEVEEEKKKAVSSLAAANDFFAFEDLEFPVSDDTPRTLKADQIRAWAKQYRYIDVNAELVRLIGWYNRDGPDGGLHKRWPKAKWFVATANWLAKVNREQAAKAGPDVDPEDPDGSKRAAARKAETMAMIKGLATEKAAPVEA